MADVVGDLVFDTTINSGQFDAGLAKLENNAKKAANNVDKAAQKVATLRLLPKTKRKPEAPGRYRRKPVKRSRKRRSS